MWQSIIVNMVVGMLPQVIGILSLSARSVIQDMALQLYNEARKSENPYDDIFASGLLAALGIPAPKK